MDDKNTSVDSILDTLGMRPTGSGLKHLLDEARKTPGDYAYVSPSCTVDSEVHRDLHDVPHEYSAPEHVIKLTNGSRIVFVTEYRGNLDRLRGLNVDGVVREGFKNPSADSLRAELNVILPTLLVRNGWLVFAKDGRHMRVR